MWRFLERLRWLNRNIELSRDVQSIQQRLEHRRKVLLRYTPRQRRAILAQDKFWNKLQELTRSIEAFGKGVLRG
jgi:hypothetical protein